jgi:predicted kinase
MVKGDVMSKKDLTLWMTKGLPASGKSMWAEQFVLERPAGSVVRVNKDLLRKMLNADRFKGKTERRVVDARNALVRTYLADGVSVVVDDTNLNFEPNEGVLRQIAAEFAAKFEVVDFTHVPLDTCIERDRKRQASVGESVIRKMWFDFVHVPPAPIEVPADAPKAVICDIDGTLAKMSDRSPFAWSRVAEDTPIVKIVELVRLLHAAGLAIVFVSGRDAVCFSETQVWLDTHVGVPGPLFMRAEGDNRSDALVKRELFDTHIRGVFDVQFVLDDRDRVVHTWRHEIGLTCLQVAPGDF